MIGKTILHYRIIEKLGEGGMGVVYLAEDTKLERKVAIKFLPRQIAGNSDERKRFEIEAKAAAALNHPNIATIFAIEEHDDEMFIVMEFIKGRELHDIIRDGQLPVDQVVEIVKQIAAGLQAAHAEGIVHRDIKSSNIMVTESGQIKIMDFGLAKVAGADIQLTKEHSTLGTAAYMSPEQTRGESVDHRTDIWSFGILLYEMLAGKMPFRGDYEQAMIYSILNENPEPIGVDVPEDLLNIIAGALEKDSEKRFQSVDQIIGLLKKMQGTSTISEEKPVEIFHPTKRSKSNKLIIITSSAILLIIIALIPYYQLLKREHARDLLPQIQKLVNEQKYFDAYQLGMQAEKYLKDDSSFIRLIPEFTDFLTIISKPEGAKVYLKRFNPGPDDPSTEKEYIGVTPIKNLRVSRDSYKIFLEKKGYTSCERVFSSPYSLEGMERARDVSVEVNLLEQDKAVKNMVFVTGGEYHLVGWDAPTLSEVPLDDFFIDKYEVSNKDFKAFIDAGGYSKKQYWKYAFKEAGKSLSWAEGIAKFTDRTGLPGPRNWLNQEYPQGKGNYPVTNISWYEAAAYAEYSGKQLPTIFQWEKAARNGHYHIYDMVMPWGLKTPNENVLRKANFESNGTVAVDSLEFGISPFGCYNMAGNVKEWCLNETNQGYIITGGSWQDPVYLFASFGTFPGFYTSDGTGFRCVRILGKDAEQPDAMKLNIEERTPVYKPVDEKTFETFLTHYRYDKKPLNPTIIEKTETADWVKEKITFSGIHNEQIIAYLYLPKKVVKPYQCLNWIPHSGVINGDQRTDVAAEYTIGPHIKAGRALLAVVPKGAIERLRKPGFTSPKIESVGYRELAINYATEFSMGLDYLATRDDIDIDRLAFIGTSWGASGVGIIMAAVEKRYRSIVFASGGLGIWNSRKLPEVDPINFAPYITAPKLLLNGRYDEASPLETEVLPFFKLLSEPKQLSLTESGHVPPIEKRVPIINKWLDKTLGTVKFEN